MESTLSLKKSDFESEVGIFLGWITGPETDTYSWDATVKARIQRDTASGLRRFYFCGYDWSFLKPFASMTLLSGARTIQMPDDFGGLEGRVALSTSSGNSVFAPIDFENPGTVQQRYSEFPSLTGRPQVAALRPVKDMPKTKGQRQELFVFPQADADYVFTFQYYLLPNYLVDTTQPYAYGGAEHSETILESCLAVAEQRRDDAMTVHKMAFDELLKESIKIDARKKPQKIGYNRDLSDEGGSFVPLRGFITNPVTVNGISYE